MKTLERVLLIDDDPNTNFYNKILLSQEKSIGEILVFEMAQDALEYLQKGDNPVDLIFLDVNMPMMDGWQFLEHYQQLEEKRKAKVIVVMLTSSASLQDKEKAEAFGLKDQFFNKPLTPQLIQEILSIVEKPVAN